MKTRNDDVSERFCFLRIHMIFFELREENYQIRLCQGVGQSDTTFQLKHLDFG